MLNRHIGYCQIVTQKTQRYGDFLKISKKRGGLVFTTPYYEEYNGGLNLLIQNKKKVENMSAQQQPSQQQISPATRLLKIAKSTGATDGCPIFTAFAHQLFAHTPETELETRSDQELLDLCEEVFGVLETPLKDGDIKLEMLNPSYTHHSMAVINMYDQPFLVDSLWLELNRRGIEIHHTYHPIFNVKRDGKNKLSKIKTFLIEPTFCGEALPSYGHVSRRLRANLPKRVFIIKL